MALNLNTSLKAFRNHMPSLMVFIYTNKSHQASLEGLMTFILIGFFRK